MNILGAIIQAEDIRGISMLQPVMMDDNFYYSFSVITRSGLVEFKSEMITDWRIATKQEQQTQLDFKTEYLAIRKHISYLLAEGADDFNSHQENVDYSYGVITKYHQDLYDKLSASKAKNKSGHLELLQKMVTHIIVLKNLAEFYKDQ